MTEGGEGGYQTAADCIAAGMYWFSQSDLAAAEAWWQRALEIEPSNPRALECLRLLQRTSSTGFKSDSWARLPAVGSGLRRAAEEATSDVFRDPLSGSAAAASSPDDEGPWDERPDPLSDTSGTHDLMNFVESVGGEANERPTSDLRHLSVPARSVRGTGSDPRITRSPWDEGPSRTSVVTVKSSGEFDAVAEPTPLPRVDRERFFSREDPESREEIVDFLRATGDLPPFELEGNLPDAVQTEPTERASVASPRAALDAARAKFQLHDFQGVLELLEGYPADGAEQVEVRSMLAESRSNLLRMYEAKIGSLEQVPRVSVSSEEVIWLNLNHRAGFILSQVDGTVTYEDLISLSGMPRLDTVRILIELLDQKVIGV